ncbi:MAG: hypothetical protein ACRENA_02760 [Vulcanimicrobiaceae bacterium]
MRLRSAALFAAVVAFAATIPVSAQMGGMGGMKMPENPAHVDPTRQAYTTNHQFLVKLISLPRPIPYEKYFKVRFEVFDGANPSRPLPNARVVVFAGMRHGMKSGFAHGMESSPKVSRKNGVVTVSGLYFHMMGPWTLQTTVHNGGKEGVAYFDLPCCGS